MEVKAETQGTNLKAGLSTIPHSTATEEKTHFIAKEVSQKPWMMLFANQTHVQLAFLTQFRMTYLGNGATHSGLDPRTFPHRWEC